MTWPDGYTRLEYIQSNDSHQYIDTGYTPDSDTRVVMDFQFNSSPTSQSFMFGSRESAGGDVSFTFNYHTTGAFRADYYSTKKYLPSSINETQRLTVDMDKNVASIDGQQVTFTAKTFTCGGSMFLFATRQGDTVANAYANMKLYSCQVYDDGQLVRAFIPAKRDSDGAVGLYDLANGAFYASATSSPFIAGTVVNEVTLSYNANDPGATGSTASQQGYPGDTVTIAQCGFTVPGKSFAGWNTAAAGTGTTYQPGADYTLADSDATLYAQRQAVTDQLTYNPNATTYGGATPATVGTVGQQVQVASCGFTRQNYEFVAWNTASDGSGTAYDPGDLFTLTTGDDVLYAVWEFVTPGGKAPWAVFSDTWGTLTGYSASRDDSNYKNKVFVLYDYDVPTLFSSTGVPETSHQIENLRDPATGIKILTQVIGYSVWIPYRVNRGYSTQSIAQDGEPEIETYLDRRDEKPSCDNLWKRDVITKSYEEPVGTAEAEADMEADAASLVTADDDGSIPDMKAIYEAFDEDMETCGAAYLQQNYPVETVLDTGTVNTSAYLRDFDLGDKVDFAVSTVGLAQTGRIVEVEEVYESGSVQINVTIGDKTLTRIKKGRLA